MRFWRRKGHRAESDVEFETHEARSRKGVHGDGHYVGRTIGHDDALDVGETGAEARARESEK
jgi:hypothetical protein